MKVPIRIWQKTIITAFVFSISLTLLSDFSNAGFHEEKLFDSEFYSAEDLKRKVEYHNREIEILGNQIKTIETDIDWLILKINQIEDSGRSASYKLESSIHEKEKKLQNLHKSKSRLEYLVQYYNSMLDSSKKKGLEDIIRKKASYTKKKTTTGHAQETSLQPVMPASTSAGPVWAKDEDLYDGVSKIELENAVKKAGLSDWVEIVGTGSCLRIETTMPILFPTGSAAVASEYKNYFKKLADFLKPYDVKVMVTGYADKVPIKNKKYPSNFELGATRAANIVHQFVSHGLKPSIFRIESTGKYRFESKQVSPQKSLERRAEVTVIFSG